MRHLVSAFALAFAAYLGLGSGLGPQVAQAQQQKILESRESLYNNIFVVGDGENVYMTFGHNKRYYTESGMRLSDPNLLTVGYTQFMTLGIAYQPKATRILEIGLGGGRTVTYMHNFMPAVKIVAVELDVEVANLAKKYFGFKETENLNLVVADGRSYVLKTKEKWDVIMVDAYRGPFVPFHLLTKEFYQLLKDRLNPGGVIVQNVEPTTMLFDAAAATVKSIFSSVDMYDADGNVVMIAYDGPSLSQDELKKRAAEAQAQYKFRHDITTMIGRRRVLEKVDAKRVLTDEFAPVETLRAIEQHNKKWQENTTGPRQ